MNFRSAHKLLFLFLAFTLLLPITAYGHCDSVAGPVAKDVRAALDSGQIAPVLKWVRAEDEAELRAAFGQALLARKSGKEAALVADQFFLETAIRLHRASEGQPYTGVKSATVAEEPAPALVDAALKNGSFEHVQQEVLANLNEGLRQRIEKLQVASKTMNQSAESGRQYVRAYVELVHYVERLQMMSNGSPHEGHE